MKTSVQRLTFLPFRQLRSCLVYTIAAFLIGYSLFQTGGNLAKAEVGNSGIAGLPVSAKSPVLAITVTRNDDRNSTCASGVDCSLREAVNAANSSAENDTITFAQGISLITLTGGEIVIANNGTLTIQGPGANVLAISGNSNGRIFQMNQASVIIANITLTDGNGVGATDSGSGGAIYAANGSLTLESVFITNNSASVGDQRGGGVFLIGGTHRIRNSTISGNGANRGGGISTNTTTLYLVCSTVSDNNGVFSGGLEIAGNITLRNVTITKNNASGGEFNGGGISFGSGGLNIGNTIIAGNTAGGFNSTVFQEIRFTGGTITSVGNNLLGAAPDAGHPAIGPLQPTFQPSDRSTLNARISPLGFNGGAVPSRKLLKGSPAIDAGDNALAVDPANGNAVLSFDQRGIGYARVVDGNNDGTSTADIGAFERNPTFDNPPYDFDGDGNSDLSIYRPGQGEWWITKSNDQGILATQFGTSTDRLAPADFTGDGKIDIAFFRPSTGVWFVLRSEDFSFFAFPFGTNGDTPAPGDFDGDGKADAAIFRPATATWYINKSSGGTTIQQFGVPGDLPIIADYDGDGKSDISIYRPSVGQWWLQRSATGLIAITFGNSSDKTVPGDFTGDGRADVAFWRPSTGQWYILRSENLSFFAFPFGSSTDIPSPGDYDGDGKMDAAVFRPSNSTWYAQRSTAGLLIQQFGAPGDVPVPSAYVR